jgi:hypothetical protein
LFLHSDFAIRVAAATFVIRTQLAAAASGLNRLSGFDFRFALHFSVPSVIFVFSVVKAAFVVRHFVLRHCFVIRTLYFVLFGTGPLLALTSNLKSCTQYRIKAQWACLPVPVCRRPLR